MEEITIWKGTPSQWVNITTYAVCGFFTLIFLLGSLYVWQIIVLIIVPSTVAYGKYLKVKNTVYEITNQRLVIRTGILSKLTEQIEFYRIKDISLVEPFFLRLVGLANLVFVSTDRVEGIAPINGIRDGMKIREELRNAIENVRKEKNVFVRDF